MTKEFRERQKAMGMVHIIKDGIENFVSPMTWELAKNSKDGWELFEDITEGEEIPTTEIKLNDGDSDEVKALKKQLEELKETQTKEEPAIEDTVELSVDEMKEYLVSVGIKVHHKAGDKKIKELYNENKK